MRIAIVLSGLCLALAFGAEPPEKPGQTQAPPQADRAPTAGLPRVDGTTAAADLILLERKSRELPPVAASPDERSIARLTAGIVASRHYLQRPFDDEISSRFFDRYFEMLDGWHLHFTQTDLREFETYRNTLDELTKTGETRPAREIFARFLQRLDQRAAFVSELLQNEKFEFTGDDRYNPDRRKARNPEDLDAARQLWRQHLRYEYLLEKLAVKKQETNRVGAVAPPGQAQANPPAKAAPATDAAAQHAEIVKTIARRYARILRMYHEYDGGDVFQIYLSSLLHAYDPHSDYYGKFTLENFAINMSQSLFGIGAVLRSEDGYCKVEQLKPGPAMRSKKVKPGDRIVAVAQGDNEPVEVVDMKFSKVVSMIRGPKGTKVRLTLLPVDAPDQSTRTEVSLVREEIKIEDEEAKASIIDAPVGGDKTARIGVIDLPSFYSTFDVGTQNGRATPKSTTEDVTRLLKKLMAERVAGVVLDLRSNGGGSLEEAIRLTGLFIKQGPIVQVKDSQNPPLVDEDPDPAVLYDGPLIVLTSRFSASASEILAGALQDYGRALIVGDSTTHGKGTVQSVIELTPLLQRFVGASTNNPGALKLTIRMFYRVNGDSTQRDGVTPDVVLPSINNHAEVGEASLENALTWKPIPAAKFDRLGLVQPLLPELLRRSEVRVTSDQDFAYLREDIDLYKKFLADKSVSLNEEVRRKEKKEQEERVAARKKERDARREPEEKLYKLTLKEVNLPGLPDPAKKEEAESKPASAASDAEDAESDETHPPVDVTLKEAKRILLDLIALSPKAPTVAERN